MPTNFTKLGVPLVAGAAVLIGAITYQLNPPPGFSHAVQQEGGEGGLSLAPAEVVPAMVADTTSMLDDTAWTLANPEAQQADPDAHFIHADGWEASYGPGGLYAVDADGWSMQVRAVAVRRDDMLAGFSEVPAQRHDALVEYHRGMMVEWYDHDARGVHHGMTFPERPPGQGALQVDLSVESSLTPTVFAEGVSILYRDADGNPAMAYDGLLVVDANGQVLPSQMNITDDGLRISVDDDAATYPLTIDPVFERVTPGSISLFVDRAEFVPGGQWKIHYGYAHYGVADDYTTEIPLGGANRYTTTPVAGPSTPPTLFHAGRHVQPPITLAKKQKITWTVTYLRPDGTSKTKTSAAGSYFRKISPIVENGGCSYRVPGSPEGRRTEWGYYNRMPFPLTVPYSGQNKLTAPASHGGDSRPTFFLPGRQVKTHTTSWLVDGPTGGSRVVWTLQNRTATAGADKVCEPVNSPPVAADLSVWCQAGGQTIAIPPVSDPDGDDLSGLTIVASSLPGGISAEVIGLSITFTVPADTSADAAWVEYTVQDSHGAVSNVARVSLDEIRYAPYLGDASLTAFSGVEKAIALDLRDTDGDGEFYDDMRIVVQPEHGTLTGIPGETIYYTPDVNYVGPDHFILELEEDSLLSGHARFDIDVQWSGVSDTTLISRSEVTGHDGSANSQMPILSNNRRYIYFLSYASDMADEDGMAGPDLFCRDMVTGDVRLLTPRQPGVESRGNAIGSFDVTPDGRYIVFASNATNLAGSFRFGEAHIFLLETESGAISMIDRNELGHLSASSYSPSISDDGRYVCFSSASENLTDGQYDLSHSHIFVKDLSDGSVELISKTAGGVLGNGASLNPQISGDGNRVSFRTRAGNLIDADASPVIYQAVVYDRGSRQHILASRQADGSFSQSAAVYQVFINTDGSKLVFDSPADDLSDLDPAFKRQAYVFDVASRQVSMVSRSMVDGQPAADHVNLRGFSAEGGFATFWSAARNLVGTASFSGSNCFVANVDSGIINVVSRGTDNEPSGPSTTVVPSQDGQFIGFMSLAQNLTDENLIHPDVWQLYVTPNPLLTTSNQ